MIEKPPPIDPKRAEQILAAVESAQRLRGALYDTERALAAIEGARVQFSSAETELRAQLTSCKERLVWVTRELDTLKAKLSVELGDAH